MVDFLNDEVDAVRGRVGCGRVLARGTAEYAIEFIDFVDDQVGPELVDLLVDGGWRAGVLSAAETAGGGLERVSVLDAGSPEGPKRKRFPLVRECESALVPLLHGAA